MNTLSFAAVVIFAIVVAYGNFTDPTEENITNAPKTFCDYPGCTCYYYKDPCPEDYYNCSATRYCTLSTNRPCCN